MKQDLVSHRIVNSERFNLDDFKLRWLSARVGVLRKNISASQASEDSLSDPALTSDEFILLQEVLKLDQAYKDQVLKHVFDVSRKFALSASRYFGVTWELSDFSDVLPLLDIPCFSARFEPYKKAYLSKRNGCNDVATLGAFGCSYWREALDGLVMGLGETERLSRHSSVGYGGTECVDILFTEEVVLPRIVSEKTYYKYAPLKEDMELGLLPVQEQFKKMDVHLVWEGLSEGVLFYKMESKAGPVCGAGGRLMHQDLEKKIKKIFPQLKLKDASPLAVYGEKA